ncbi:MAG: DUF1501 domain-containing protein [Verrucomicrobia bacterium]|nr:DUF1501 domain-containing protein [Verrucomicrobiota bacterium]
MTPPNILTRRSFLRRSALFAGAGAAAGTLRDMKLMNSLMAAEPPTGYKALVCVFMAGGNDANNWIVPTDTTTYNEYAGIRGNLALPSSSLLPLRTGPSGSDPAYNYQGRTYGFHPGCARLQALFGEKKLAIVQNVGTLVRPTTKAQYNSGLAAYRPPQLFSHSDQVTQWQTSIPDAPPATGWGGRIADIYDSVANPTGKISMSVSLNGANTLQIGNLVSQYHVSTAGAVVMNSSGSGGGLMGSTGARQKAIQSIVDLNHANLQRQAYANVLDSAIFTGDLLNNNIAATDDPTDAPAGGYTTAQQAAGHAAGQTFKWNTGLTGIYNPALTGFTDGLGGFPNTGLGIQLKMIARLIAANGPSAFDMKRQIFFCSAGGFDTHTAQVDGAGFTNQPANAGGTHYGLMTQISEAMFAFQRAMEQLDGANPAKPYSTGVTAFTASDFSRTFPTNSQGSDHGWGSHHIIVGGAVDGGKMVGKLPAFAINGPDDTGTGRWLPTFSVDEHTATLAKWYGLGQSDIASVLPNIGRFNSTFGGGYLNFMKPA